MDNVSKLRARLEEEFNRTTARELGMPDGMDALTLTMDAEAFNADWRGFILEFAGDRQPPPKFEREYMYAESDGIGIRVWRMRIRRDDAAAYLEAKTRPGYLNFTSIDLRDVDPLDRGGNTDVLTKSLQMLFRSEYRQGRKPGSRDVSQEQIRVLVKRYVQRREPDRIRLNDFLEEHRHLFSERTWKRYAKAYGFKWRDLVQEATADY